MARADLLLSLVRAGSKGDQTSFRKAVEALIAEERSKQHHILAERLSSYLVSNGSGLNSAQTPNLRNGQTTDLFYEIEPRLYLRDLILSASVELACKELIEEQERTDLLRAHNLEPRNRILLAGSPGNGKTSLAEALANELAIPFLVVRYEGVIASFLGETAVRLSKLFEQIRSRRCVLFLDEFDVIGKERGDIHETGEIKRVVSSLLLQMDALPSYVIVVTATNHPELLDRATWRRFQLRLELSSPSPIQIEEWFRRFEKRLGVAIEFNINTLAKRLKGMSFSEIEQFGLDVQRQYVLSQPESNIRRIINERLEQWAERYTLPRMTKGKNTSV